ncbi:MAG: ABC transporter ATP-binding protein [Methanoculleus sp.]|uniref:ABC transporter ATP-binding protein n=1 Tax=unclassified Methanoculleus TaxID=2619537 RepID=UPI0025CDFB42|nr:MULTISPECIES: ABC transporter ATP-binding protein [unclassified Methanoculleus]MCK9317076.1 ABC transporter ATP-binding protein/permease [Methanoculleus sp.]MDD2253433.1 ABC transporter ATP-binding protein [Methanoculleus sp.]MDD3214988.1 ABC transporter ATP-binding protein [Methanoculleus sp.]MDD4313962.1 ABC transporter ATP-binding protein [Methanoculleus sp.]MDD4470303.1 ABC transporter ATP-binding protein [Methanoculleus sp.]
MSITDYCRRTVAFTRDIMRQPAKVDRDLQFSDLVFFLRFARPIWSVGVLALVATALVSAAKTVLPLSIKFLIDNILLGETPLPDTLLAEAGGILSSLNILTVALLALGLFTGGMDLARNYWTARFREGYAFNLQTTLVEHVLSFPLSYFKSRQTGYIMSRLSDDVQILQYTFSQYLPQIIANALYVAFTLVILFILNLRLTLVVIAFIPLYLLVNAVFIRRIRAATHQERERQAYVSRDLQEVISGIDTVKSHAAEDREVRKVSGTLRNMVNARIRNTMLSALSEYFRIGTMSLMLIAAFWFGGNEVLAGGMTVGDFVAFAVYIVTFAPTVNTFFAFPVVMQPALTSAGRLRELFRMSGEAGTAPGTGGIAPADVQGLIEFSGVWFGYAESDPVIRDATFVARPGETVAVVGRTGVGKTTLINLILRAFMPQRGTITLDKRDLSSLDPRWLRRQVSLVSQDLFLFHTTIEENIRYSKPDATFEEVIGAARKAQIHEDIMQFSEGYGTIVGDRGTQLSVGQRQRVAIARAFLKDAPILILDEPTSALDLQTEDRIRQILRVLTRGRTTILISHRPSLLELADRVLTIEGGRVRECRGAADGIDPGSRPVAP